MNMFEYEFENIAIERIKKFAKIAKAMNFDICVGFSGGKDSQVVYDLMLKSGVNFKAYYNIAFESNITKKFIKQCYPGVIWRRSIKEGFISNIIRNHNGMFPTATLAYCCKDYKHNPKNVDNCSVVGVRKAESVRRRKRTAFEIRSKTLLKKNKDLIDSYFSENCQSTGNASIIQLKPIIDWSDAEVWDYIKRYDLPINPEYKDRHRIGCMVCPKANFSTNYKRLLEYPRLIDAFILAHERSGNDWVVNRDKDNEQDCSNDKCYYICRWLNHSFMPFTAKQQAYYLLVSQKYKHLNT